MGHLTNHLVNDSMTNLFYGTHVLHDSQSTVTQHSGQSCASEMTSNEHVTLQRHSMRHERDICLWL